MAEIGTIMSSAPDSGDATPIPTPPITNYILGFLLIGLAWGFTTPFIRRAAKNHKARAHPTLERLQRASTESGGFKGGFRGIGAAVKERVVGGVLALADILRDWRYALPLVINLTGSVWFFLLIGQAELSLTVPITNSMAFLFTVLGDWYVDRKIISRNTWFGMILSLSGIALCVHSKL